MSAGATRSLIPWRVRRVPRAVFHELRLWSESLLFHMPGEIGIALRSSYLRRCVGMMGEGCRLSAGSAIYHPRGLRLHNRVLMGRIFVNAKGGVEIGDDCLIADGAKIWSVNHRFVDISVPIAQQGYDEQRVIIGSDVWIAANAIILPGVTVGNGAVVGAGAVVTKDVGAFEVVAGVPARLVGRRGSASAGGASDGEFSNRLGKSLTESQ